MTLPVTKENFEVLSCRGHKYWMGVVGEQIPSMGERIFLGLAISGELGELNNLIKKEWRDGEDLERQGEIRKEIADVYIYLLHLARSYGGTPEEFAIEKTKELVIRWPQAYDNEQLDG
jgi:NTP pyrophosphatase (non-canonical NTP hydrolase)